MTPRSWSCPLSGGTVSTEYALSFDHDRDRRVLVAPALFDEGNRMRRFTVDVMRALDRAGIDSVLPDLPGTNESPLVLEQRTCGEWRAAMEAAAREFAVTHVLGIRGGCLFTPPALPRWHYAPIRGSSILRQMIRARLVSAVEAGRAETREELMATGTKDGLELAGYRVGSAFFAELDTLEPVPGATELAQAAIGGAGLWLRAEPGEAPEQAEALAALIAGGIAP